MKITSTTRRLVIEIGMMFLYLKTDTYKSTNVCKTVAGLWEGRGTSKDNYDDNHKQLGHR